MPFSVVDRDTLLSIDREEIVFQWRGECDFVLSRGEEVRRLVQVTWEMTDPETRNREFSGLLGLSEATGCADLTIVTRNEEDE